MTQAQNKQPTQARVSATRFAASGVIMAAFLVAGSGTANAQNLGTWLTDDRKAKIELRECGKEKLCSAIVWLKDPVDEKGKPWRDILNPDPSMRRRQIVGLDILKGLKKVGPKTWSGEIYDPEEGKYYFLKRISVGTDQVEIRGCLSSGWPCRSKYWSRTKSVRPPAPAIQVAKPKPAPKKPVQVARQQPAPAPQPVQAAKPRPAAPAQQQARVVSPAPAVIPPANARVAAAPPPVKKPAPVRQATVAAPATAPARRAQPQAQPQQRRVASTAPTRGPATTGSLRRPAAAPPGSYLVQVTAGQNQNEALRYFGKLQRRYPNLLGGYLPNIQRVDLGAKGVWYRVRVGPMERHAAAATFCQQLKAAGADCLIRQD